MEQTVSSFLKALQIPISEKYIQKLILAHPDFPSLVSISDTLQRLGIDNISRRIDPQSLEQLPFPYLLLLDKGRGDVLLIRNKYDLFKHKNDLDKWSGIVLQAEQAKRTKDKLNISIYNSEVRIRYFSIALLATLFILLALLSFNSFSFLSLILLFTALTGVTAGYFLLAKEMGVTYQSVETFCNGGKNTDCDKVLNAEINLFGIKFSDATVIYFLFQAVAVGITIAIQGEHIFNLMQLLAWLSIPTLPIIIFSIYYQWFVIKTWCRLCLVIVIILATQFAIFIIGYFQGDIQLFTKLPLSFVSKLTLLLASLTFLVLLIKAIVERSNALEKVGKNGNRVKHSLPVFTQLLVQQKRIVTGQFDNEIVLGSSDAPINIIAVSGLYCNPCRIKHEVINQLVDIYSGKVNVTLRFVPEGKDVRAVGYLLGYWLQCVRNKNNESENTMKLMHDWFDLWNLERFMKKYPVDVINSVEIEKIETQHYKWVNEVGIKATPTFFINGYELPKEYTIDDLLVLTPSLADSYSEKEKIETTLQTIAN